MRIPSPHPTISTWHPLAWKRKYLPLPAYHDWASSLSDVSASLKAIFSHRPEKIYVGHGGPLDGERALQFFTR